jgi:hypothetical protein
LERLGFPWILSSESIVINGLRWIFAERNFSRAFTAAPKPWEREPTILAYGTGLIDHGESLILFLIFCKKLLSEPFHSSRLHPKATRSESLIPGCARLTVDLM